MYYVTNNNIKIAVCDLNPSSSKAVVMIHGWPLSERIFDYQKQMLVSCGFRVVTIDLRGYGKSDVPACGYRYNDFASDIYTVVKTLKLRNFVLTGFSMGGAIACRYMGRYNGYGVRKLCLLGAAAPRFTQCPGFPYGVTKESVDEMLSQISNDRAQFCEAFSRKLLYSPHSEEIKDWFEDIALGASQIGTFKAGCSLRDEDCRSDLRKICVPTGVFHGEQDEIVPYELGVLQSQLIRDCTLFSFENSGHGIFYDELDRFNRCFLDFIRS